MNLPQRTGVGAVLLAIAGPVAVGLLRPSARD